MEEASEGIWFQVQSFRNEAGEIGSQELYYWEIGLEYVAEFRDCSFIWPLKYKTH